jgi:Cu/Ag efflux protein CusF/cytochrome c553
MFIAVMTTTLAACTSQEPLKPVAPDDFKTYKSVGVVKTVDGDGGRLTIDHEEIPGYMEPMEMNEKVRDRGLLNGITPGDKVDFEIERRGSDITISKITKIGVVKLINGGEIYKTSCAECHGPNGEGAKQGISLVKGHALSHPEKEMLERVTNGKDRKMPAFRDKLSPEEITAVVKFVRNEIQKDATPEDREKHKHRH